MSSRVCAVVVAQSDQSRLRECLKSLLAQTRPVDRIVVIDNRGEDGTPGLPETEFPQVSRLNLKQNAGASGALNAGMRWAHCNKFDWIWVMDDRIEVLPDCLRTMLQFENAGDLIQVRQRGRADNRAPDDDVARYARVQYCDFEGALIGRKVIETAGLPDPRYFNIGDDTAYGYVASRRVSSICLNYAGVIKHSDLPAPNREAFYLSLRNRFLTREYLAKNGAPLPPGVFLAETMLTLLKTLRAAVESPEHKMQKARAAIDGLRDGIHRRFDRVPAARAE